MIHKDGSGSLDMEGFGGQFVVSAYNTTTKVATISLNTGLELLTYVPWNWSYSIGSNRSNKLGQIGGAFYMPLATFRSGERIMRVTESFNNSYDSEAISYADKSFVSSGIHLSKTNLVETVFNTTIDTTIVGTQTSDKMVSTKSAGTEIVNRYTATYVVRTDPLAQTFFVDPQLYPYGTFVELDMDENLFVKPTILYQIEGDSVKSFGIKAKEEK